MIDTGNNEACFLIHKILVGKMQSPLNCRRKNHRRNQMKIKFTGDLSLLEEGIQIIAELLQVTLGDGEYVFDVAWKQENKLTVTLDGHNGTIVYNERCAFFRAFGLAVEQIKDGNTHFAIEEPVHFDMNGPMFDVSQGNAAFNIKTMKSILRQLSLMGLNMAMLYCEDSFEVQNQPYFGYMRARYSEAEMKELDDYAYALGIEMIPCIQTLAHMPDPLRWECYRPIRDYAECVMVGEEKTYEFIRDLLISASRPFRTKKIHIGMDEAGKLGLGQYLRKNGYRPKIELMKEHLERVNAIVRELGLEPMMWGDMFFRALSPTGAYRVEGMKTLPEGAKDAIPEGMGCVYWDYYSLTHAHYEERMDLHLQLTDNVIFAGGIWTWVGFSLAWNKTLITTEAALDTCKKMGVRKVFITIWGDNGTECLANTTLIGCQLFAEHQYSDKLDYEKFKKRFAFCTGGCVEDFEKLELLDKNPQNESLEDPSNYNASKYLMWQDILTGLCDKNIEGYEMDAHYEKLAAELLPTVKRNGQFNGMFEFSYHAANVLAVKSEMGLRLAAAYKAGDREALRHFADVELPDLKARMQELRRVHMENWFELYKPLGWDIMDMRYGSLFVRIDSAIEELHMYLDGKLDRLEELEQERLLYGGVEGSIKYLNYFGDIVSPSRIAPKA